MSFSEVVKAGPFINYKQKQLNNWGPRKVVFNDSKDDVWKGLSFNIPEEEMKWLRSSYV